MKITLKRLGLMGASVITPAMMAIGGVAAADSGSWNGTNWQSYQSSHCHRYQRPSYNNRSLYYNRYTQTNNNTVTVTNTNTQTAVTGNATVMGNLWGGSATSGDAYNSNSTSTNISINN